MVGLSCHVHIIAVTVVIADLAIITRWYDPYNITFIDARSRHRHIDIVGAAAISSHIVFVCVTLLDLSTPAVGVLCCCFIGIAAFV